jgi:hypothetical protein
MALEKKGKDFWGESYWTALHSATAAYKPSREKYYRAYFESLPYLLPCDDCGEHLIANMKKIPIDNYLRSNHDLFFYGYMVHDLVNQQCNARRKRGDKIKYSPPFDDVKDRYFRALNEECEACSALMY